MKTGTARLLPLIFVLVLLAAACGGSDSDDETTTTAAAVTTTTAATRTTAPAATTTTAAGTTTTAGGGGVELTIAAEDSEGFNKDRLEAPAGVEVTVTFQNKDVGSGEPHNWHLRTDTGDWFTPITDAPDTNSVAFTVDAPGEYDYFCDTHLEAMKGTFIATSG